MLHAKKLMYIPLNLKVEFENVTVAYEKLNVESANLNVAYKLRSVVSSAS